MKKFFASNKFEILYVSFVLSVIIIFGTTIKKEKISLPGKWTAEFAAKKVEFTFHNDGRCLLNIIDKENSETFHLSGRYELDFSKKPIALSIKKIPQLSYSLYTIIEFINSNTIIMEFFDSKWRLRPVAFNSRTSMILRRVE